MRKTSSKKLRLELHKETVAVLSNERLRDVMGGSAIDERTGSTICSNNDECKLRHNR